MSIDNYIIKYFLRCLDPNYAETIDGFPIEIETKISKLITYNLAIFYNINIAKLYLISLLICVSISIGNPPYVYCL